MSSEDEIKAHDEAVRRSRNSREIELDLFGDRNTVISVISLLSQIRHAVQSNTKTEIKLTISGNISGGEFDFLADNEKVDDLFPQENFYIN